MIIICALLCVDSAMMVLWIFVDPMQRKISNVTTEVCTIYVDPMQRKISNVTTEVCMIGVCPFSSWELCCFLLDLRFLITLWYLQTLLNDGLVDENMYFYHNSFTTIPSLIYNQYVIST